MRGRTSAWQRYYTNHPEVLAAWGEQNDREPNCLCPKCRPSAEEMPVGTVVQAAGLTLTLCHGRKPWRSTGGRYRFSHAEVNGSLDDGDARVLSLGTGKIDEDVAVV